MTKARRLDGASRPIEILGVRSGLGGRDPGAAGGADSLRAAGFAERLRAGGLDARWGAMLEPLARHAHDPSAAMARLGPKLARTVQAVVLRGAFPVVIGGDHSCAIGTWSGAATAMRPRGSLGLLWIDAHLDAHTPETSHTGLLYGMPLAALLGHGERAFTECLSEGPKVRPEHVCIVGARSYEAEERALLDRLGVRVIGMQEIATRGLAAALEEAVAVVRAADAGYGISLDLDVIDPRDAPGVGTPAPGGVRAAELVAALEALAADEALQALEITEYNPLRDRHAMTLELAMTIAGTILGARSHAAREPVAGVA